MCDNEQSIDKTEKKKERLVKWRRNLFWILFVFLIVYFFGISALYLPYFLALEAVGDIISPDLYYVLANYTPFINDILVVFLLTWLIRPNRYVWKSFLLPKKGASAVKDESDALAEFYGRGRNSVGMLGCGVLLGFLMNGFGIACALIHGDFRLQFNFSAAQIPLMLFALLSVLIQSSSEEMWCRGFLFERLHERFPLWVAIAINGILFGLLHSFNPGVTVLSLISIAICGVSYTLIRWYTGSIWIAFGLHTGWNFMQAFLFGLPNSGLVSEFSVFHPDTTAGVSNLIYNYEFGVEGTLTGLLPDLALIVIVLILAARKGRLKELAMNRERTMAMSKETAGEPESV